MGMGVRTGTSGSPDRSRTFNPFFNRGPSAVLCRSGVAQRLQPAMEVARPGAGDPLPHAFDNDERVIELRLTLPPDVPFGKETTERFLQGLRYCQPPLSFELIGLPAVTCVQLACRASDKVHIERQVHAYFPEVAIAVSENFLREIWGAAGSAEWVVVDFGLSEEFMLPIRTCSGFDPDPLIA